MELIFRKTGARARLVTPGLAIASAFVVSLSASAVLALDPMRSVGQYRRVSWGQTDGAPSVNSVAQTRDGFLWIAGGQGLYRFDGATFEPVVVGGRKQGFAPEIGRLLTSRDGHLIIGFAGGGVGLWKDERFVPLSHPDVTGSVMDLAEDGDGAIWVAQFSRKGSLARYRAGKWELIGPDWGGPKGLVFTLMADRRGDLWAAGDGELYRLKKGQRRFERVGIEIGTGPGLAQAPDGGVWVSDSLGVRRLDPNTLTIDLASVRAAGQKTRKNQLRFDRDGNLWGATVGGGAFVIRPTLPAGRSGAADSKPIETLTAENGLAANLVWDVLEDREGNIWFASGEGLVQFTPAPVAVQEQVQKFPAWDYGLFRLGDGTVYVSDERMLYRARPGEPLKPWLPDLDYICEDPAGVQWVGKGDRLFRLENGKRTRVPFPAWLTNHSYCKTDPSGLLWIAMLSHGIVSFDGKTWRPYEEPDGGGISVIGNAPDGLVTAGGRRRLFRSGPNGLTALTPTTLDMGRITSIGSDPSAVVAGTRYGMIRLRKAEGSKPRRAETLSADQYPWANDVLGSAVGPDGRTWVLSKEGLASVPTAQLDQAFRSPGSRVDARLFDYRDGLVGLPRSKGADKIVIGGDGRVWVGTPAAIVMVDPARLPHNTLRPPVVIRSVTVDGKTTRAPRDLVLPKGARSLQIDYTALSLTVPERVRFRYKLEGVDQDWVDPGRRRQAFYTNLKPGKYVFRVKASNNDGVWNEDGAALQFQLPPTFLQSKLFLALCLVGAAALVALVYRLRLRQVSEQIRIRLQERLFERERIARELHDTLLQGVQGLVLKFQSASGDVPAGTPARESLEQALDRAEDMMIEARERVRSLRAAPTGDLAATLAEVAERMDPERRVATRVVTEGAARDLHPVVFDEIERIVTEALFNAYSHARAGTVVVEVAYDAPQLGVRVRDDGVGIEQAVLDAGGRDGHFGLAGMRERAEKIDGQFVIRSRPGAGTEVEVTIPANSAYRRQSRAWLPGWTRSALSRAAE